MRKPVGKNPVRIQKIPEPVSEEVDEPETIQMEIKDIPKEEIFENKSNKVEALKKEAPEPTYRRKRQLSEKQLAALAKGRAAKAAKRERHKKDREELLKLRLWKQQMEKNTEPQPRVAQPRVAQPRVAQPRVQPKVQPRRRTMTKEQLGQIKHAQQQQFFQLLDNYEAHKKARQPAPKPKYKETSTPNPFNLHQYQRRKRRF